MALGPQHAILRALRTPRLEPQVTSVLASVFAADPALASGFVRAVLGRSKRAADPRWATLPNSFACRSEVQIPEGRVDLEFTNITDGWRVLVELKIDAGFGFDQVERYIRCLDPSDERQVLVSVTRDVPKYGDPPLDGRPNWAGSVAWAAIADDLRRLEPADPQLASQWPLLLDILEDEGSMGVTRVNPDLLRVWARSTEARHHAVAFIDGLREPLLAALQEALAPALPDLAPSGRADVAGAPSDGRRPQVDVDFYIPRGGEVRASAQLWAWEDLRFSVSVRYPVDDRAPEARQALARLAASGFENWKDRWLWRSRSLNDTLLGAPDLSAQLLDWARESFQHAARSGLFALNAAPPDQQDDEHEPI